MQSNVFVTDNRTPNQRTLTLRRAALLLLLLLLAVGTWKQLQPNPFPEAIKEQVQLIVAKGIHLCGYASFALLAWIAFTHARWRSGALIVLLLHAIVTEIGQTYVVNRHGNPTDVLINWAGLLIGTLLGWLWDSWVAHRHKIEKHDTTLEVSADDA